MEMTAVKGRRTNLIKVGWENFFLQVEFKDGRRYQYGGVPSEVKDKLARVPYPDKLFSQLVRGKYVSERIDNLPSSGVADWTGPMFDFDELPF